jgi:hypothetical protein
MGGQSSEMTIEHKARFDGMTILNGMDLHPISILRDVTRRFLPTIDLDLSDLRVRHPQRLRQMLHRLPFPELDDDLTPSFLPWQKIIQPAME